MDPSNFNAIIAALASIVTCTIGVIAGGHDFSNPSARSIKQRQLTSVYVPMVKLMKHASSSDSKHLVADLSTIIESIPEIVPPEISIAIEKLTAADKVAEADFLQIKEMVLSYYNWTRRSLGYPYDKNAIKKKFTPVYERNARIRTTIGFVFFSLWSLSTMLLVQLWRGNIFFETAVYYVLFVIFIFGVGRGFLWILSYISNWRT